LAGDWNVSHGRGVQIDGSLAFCTSGRTLHGATVTLWAVDRADWMMSSSLIQHASVCVTPQDLKVKKVKKKTELEECRVTHISVMT
jgi:hypothetical protein